MRAEDLPTGTRVRDQDGNVETVQYVVRVEGSATTCKVVTLDGQDHHRERIVSRSQLFEVI